MAVIIPAAAQALHDQIAKIDHRSVVFNAIETFSALKPTTAQAVQDGLKNIFFQTEYGSVLYNGYHLPEYNKLKAAFIASSNPTEIATATSAYAAYAISAKLVTPDATLTGQPQTDKLQTDAKTYVADATKFTDAQKSAAIDASNTGKDLHTKIITSNEYVHAVSLAMKYLSQIKEAFLLSDSGIDGKTNGDLIANTGRNVTMYDIIRPTENQLSEITTGDFNWKNFLNDQNNAYVCLQKRFDAIKGLSAFVGGLANTIYFGKDDAEAQSNLPKFVTWIESDATINYVRGLISAQSTTGSLTDDQRKAIASTLAVKLGEDIPGVEALWPPLESIIKYVESAIKLKNTNNDGIKLKIDSALKDPVSLIDNLSFNTSASKFTILTEAQVALNNVLREGREEIADLEFNADTIKELVDTVNKTRSENGEKPLNSNQVAALANKLFGANILKHCNKDNLDLLVGGNIVGKDGSIQGKARDPQFPNGYGENLPSPDAKASPLLAVPECYGARVLQEDRNDFRDLVNSLTTMQASSSSAEVSGMQSSSLWSAMQYCGSALNSATGDFAPIGSGETVSPYSSFQQAHIDPKTGKPETDYHMFTYHHESQAPVVMVTKFALAQSFAAVLLSMKDSFSKDSAKVANYNTFLQSCQDLGFSAAIKTLTADDNAKTKFADVATFVNANKDAIVKQAKGIFETNYLGKNGIMTLLASDLSTGGSALDLEESANLIFWQTDDALKCLAQNYFGDDVSLVGKKFAKEMLSKATDAGVKQYMADHKDEAQMPVIEAFEGSLSDIDQGSELIVKVAGMTDNHDIAVEFYSSLVY